MNAAADEMFEFQVRKRNSRKRKNISKTSLLVIYERDA